MIDVLDDMKLASQDFGESQAAESGETQEEPEITSDIFSSAPAVKRIPKACRFKAAVGLTEAIRSRSVVETPGDQGTWKGLLQFVGTCQRRPR